MSRFHTIVVSNVDELIGAELPTLEETARRIANGLRGKHPTLQGSITVTIKARVHDPRRRETVHLKRKAWENVGRRQARGVD